MVVKHVGVLSAARLGALIYAALGLIFGAIFALISAMSGGLVGMADPAGSTSWLGVVFGAGALIVFPLFYGFIGCLGATIVVCLYNLLARLVGGLEIDVQ